MAEHTTLDALQAFHQNLVAAREGRTPPAEFLENGVLVQIFEQELDRFWQRPRKSDQSRSSIASGKVVLDDNEFSLNDDFKQVTLALADELEYDELEAVRILLDAQQDPEILGRSFLECGIIRFHQQRKYVLDSLRLLLELDEETMEDIYSEREEDTKALKDSLDHVQDFVSGRLIQPIPGSKAVEKRIVPRCMAALQAIRPWLQKLGDKTAAAQTLGQAGALNNSEEAETIEYSRVSLLQQHETLSTVLCRCVVKGHADISDFTNFIANLQKVDRYDSLLVHQIPVIGAYMTEVASYPGKYELGKVRELNNKFFPFRDEPSWTLPYLQAAVRAWWLAEYSSFYLDDPEEAALPPNTNLDEEDRERSRQFLDSLKDGAFDFVLAAAADVKSPDWHDPVRTSMHRWLHRKSPALPTDSIPFSNYFQLTFATQLENLVDAFITNLPDVLRKLRVEEDEQRQLSPAHEQDLDLERFLLIIAYAYEGRAAAALAFFTDPDSNLTGFMQWASRRASTPLVTAFCEMLQALSSDEECAKHAHEFLLDEGPQSSGKMRRSHSLTWSQILKEIAFFLDKAKQKPAQSQTVRHRAGRPPPDFVETEPESAMMLECYTRLITKLATESRDAKQFLLANPTYNLVETLYELACSPIPPRLRGCIIMSFKAMLTNKTISESHSMWNCLDTWVSGGYATALGGGRVPQQPPLATMDRILDEMSTGFEDPVSLVQLLLTLVVPATDSSPLNDALPFPENLGSATRTPGIEVYVDYVMGLVFATKANDLQDIHQTRVLRLSCLDFMLTCLSTFNEDLIILANETNLPIDSIISATDLATYVRMHPFARVMEWMFNDKVMSALFNTIHQEPADVGNVGPDSPLILGILRGVEVVTKVLDLQTTYLELVRPIIKLQPNQRRQPVANAAYASFEDGLVTRLNLVVDLGNYCGIGHPDLTLACLKLLEKMSSSPKITAVWSGSSRHNHRNKAIVALEANGEHEAISRALLSELTTPLDSGREAESPNYIAKIYILDFLYQCLHETPSKPTIAHLLLGFKCGVESITVDSKGAFASRTTLFHGLLRLLLETPSGDAQGIRQWLVTLRMRAMRILHVLWSSPLSSSLVIEELRDNEFLFHLLLRDTVIQVDLPWEGQPAMDTSFPLTDGGLTLLDFLSLRSMSLEYVAMELCMISQGRLPGVKRRIFEALNGQITGDVSEPISIPTIFDLYDFLLPVDVWDVVLPPLQHFKNLDLSSCVEQDEDSNPVYLMERVDEILLLKRSESASQGAIISMQDAQIMDNEEAIIRGYLISTNRQKQITTQCLKLLKTWIKLLLIMVECNDFKGTAKTSFFMQALQTVLPSLEAFASERPEEGHELAKLAKVLLFKLDLSASPDKADRNGLAIGNLIGDKLYQVFQTCLQAIGKWSGTSELRAVYYEICYRYLTGMSESGPLAQSQTKTVQTVKAYGERLINVICDDAYSGEPTCQTAALIFLSELINLDQKADTKVVEALNRLNFIGVVVDSLRNLMEEWQHVFTSGTPDQKNFQNARLSLLQHLAQTRPGSKLLLQSNLFRTLETSGLFAADPELQTRSDNRHALEQHYDLLAKVVRIIGAALICRGSHNVVQGRKFLTDNRMLVTHTLKRSAGIGMEEDAVGKLAEKVEDLAEAFMVVIAATGFLESENEGFPEPQQQNGVLFH